jgi:hypothetical protein
MRIPNNRQAPRFAGGGYDLIKPAPPPPPAG